MKDTERNPIPGQPVQVSPYEAADAFSALGSETRLMILRSLVRAGPDGLSVGALQEKLGAAASTLSHHLRALVQAGVLEQRRDGRTLICHARYDRIEALAHFLICECCADRVVPEGAVGGEASAPVQKERVQ